MSPDSAQAFSGGTLRARSFAEKYSWDASADQMETFLARVVAGSALG